MSFKLTTLPGSMGSSEGALTMLWGTITRPEHYGAVINYINSQPLSGFTGFD